MNKLTHVESQRIMGVLEEALQDVQLISVLTREISSLPSEEIVELFGEDLLEQIKQLRLVEESFGELLLRKNEVDKEESPQTEDKLKQQGAGRSQPLKTFAKAFTDLRDFAYLRLVTTVEEEKSKQDILSDIQGKQSKANSDFATLQKQLQDLRNKHEKDENSRKNIINKLKDELQEIKTNASTEIKLLEQETGSKEGKDLQGHQEKFGGQSEMINKLNDQLDELIKANKKKEQNLRKRKLKTEQEVEKWINKYDNDMQEKENEIRTITNEYEQLKKELEDLEESYSNLVKERDEMLAEERRQQEAQMKEAEKIRHLNHSAAVIQRWWKDKYKKLQNDKKQSKRKLKKSSSKVKPGGKSNPKKR